MKSFIFSVVDISIRKKNMPQNEVFSISSNEWCFCPLLAAFVVQKWFAVIGPQNRNSTDGTKEISFVNCSKALRWFKRKAGSEAYLHRDDGMYHLKVINLKISRERLRGEQKERNKKKFAYRFHFNSNKSRELRSDCRESKEKKLGRVDSSESCPQKTGLSFLSTSSLLSSFRK